MSLWAKYADDHTGYCLEFANIFELDVTTATAADDVVPLFVRKTTDWSNEEEVRIVSPAIEQPCIPFEPTLPTRITLGKDTNAGHREQIRRWADIRDPALPVVHAEYDAVKQNLRLIP